MLEKGAPRADYLKVAQFLANRGAPFQVAAH